MYQDKMEEELKKKYRLSMLFDFYGELIKENHRVIYEDYIGNDLSLSEIAIDSNISRQGVHDAIKRTTKQLQNYEDKLGLMTKYSHIKQQVMKAHKIIEELKTENDSEELNEIDLILHEILEEL